MTAGPRRKPSRRPPRPPTTSCSRSRPPSRARGPPTATTGAAPDGNRDETEAADAAGHTADCRWSGRQYGRCRNFPRSRSFVVAWPNTSPVAPSPRSRCCTRGRSAGICPGPPTSRAASPAAPSSAARRRGKYLWLELGDGRGRARAHLGMSGQMLVQPGRLGRRDAPARPDPCSPTTVPSCGSWTSARSAAWPWSELVDRRRRPGAGADRAHRPRPDGGRVRPGRRGRPPCAASTPRSSAPCWTRR